ncbi:RGLG [Mytilus edulis]|uniref:RGLG n=1 Tax=Mytilus edulis TaxID=6550 RepID=A0A8S3UK42_MYTED|nr:RGLG [Mytilus edulis]
MTMTATAFIMYSLANIVGILLFWLYKKRDKREKKPSESEELENATVRRRRLKHQPSLLALLGLSHRYNDRSFCPIEDHFHSFTEVSEACKRAGLEKCGLIIGVDFTASNEWQGRKTFSSQCLHKIIPGKIYNPYQKVVSIIGQTLEPFDDDNLIPTYGFGDSLTNDEDVFSFHSNGNAYGQVTEESRTIQAIVRASEYPLSIVVVGVGDGPWDIMEDYDDFLPNRKFDNFQFVNYHSVTSKTKNPDASLALNVMMEIPHQYKIIKALDYLDTIQTVKSDGK